MRWLGLRVRVGAALIGLVVAVGVLAPAAGATTLMPGGGLLWSDPVPYDATPSAALTSVSCPAAGVCVAVGGLQTTSGEGVPVTAIESGGTWGPAATLPLPADVDATQGGALDSVSCMSATSCVAVGSYTTTTGTTDSLVIPITVSGETASSPGAQMVMTSGAGAHVLPNAFPSGVSCASTSMSSCVLVGTYQAGAVLEAFTAEPNSDGSWSALAVTPPAAAVFNVVLYDISCAPGGPCQAVGSYRDSSNNQYVWTDRVSGGVAATGVDVTLPSDFTTAAVTTAALWGISCPSADQCTAAGVYPTADQSERAVVVPIEAGVPGTALGLDGPPGLLKGISCTDASTCTTGGDASANASVATESNGTWSPLVPLPLFGPQGTVLSVACPPGGACLLAGTYLTGSSTNQSFFYYSGTPLKPSSTALPGATVGRPYTATLSATGGTGPDRWSVSTGALPSGLTLDPATGVISGTPTNAGSNGFVATVSQTGPPAQSQTVALSIAVAPAGKGAIKLTHLTTSATKAHLALKCTGGACAGTLKIAGTEHLKHTAPTAVVASATKPKPKITKKSIVLASGRYTLAPGASKTVTLTLSRKADKLLAMLHKVSGKVTVTPTGAKRPAATRTVTFKSPPRKTKKS